MANHVFGRDDAEKYIAMKLFSEIGEIIGQYAKEKYQKAVGIKLIDEIGDALWYAYAWHSLTHSMIVQNGVFEITDEYEFFGSLARNASAFYNSVGEESSTKQVTLSVIIDYLFSLCEHLGYTYIHALQVNYNKLCQRHGESFRKEFYTEKQNVCEVCKIEKVEGGKNTCYACQVAGQHITDIITHRKENHEDSNPISKRY